MIRSGCLRRERHQSRRRARQQGGRREAHSECGCKDKPAANDNLEIPSLRHRNINVPCVFACPSPLSCFWPHRMPPCILRESCLSKAHMDGKRTHHQPVIQIQSVQSSLDEGDPASEDRSRAATGQSGLIDAKHNSDGHRHLPLIGGPRNSELRCWLD